MHEFLKTLRSDSRQQFPTFPKKKKATFSYPLHAIGPNIFTQTKWVARTGIRKPKSKTIYQLKVVDLQKV